jgi:hypothetical protein
MGKGETPDRAGATAPPDTVLIGPPRVNDAAPAERAPRLRIS